MKKQKERGEADWLRADCGQANLTRQIRSGYTHTHTHAHRLAGFTPNQNVIAAVVISGSRFLTSTISDVILGEVLSVLARCCGEDAPIKPLIVHKMKFQSTHFSEIRTN